MTEGNEMAYKEDVGVFCHGSDPNIWCVSQPGAGRGAEGIIHIHVPDSPLGLFLTLLARQW